MPSSRITLHHLKPTSGRHPILQWDADMAGMGIPPPSTVILDFMYGVATYQCWGGGQDINQVMQKCHDTHYESILIPPAAPHLSDSSPEPDDPNDGDYIPNRQPRGRNHSSHMLDEMHCAMDDVLVLSMLLKGTTPE